MAYFCLIEAGGVSALEPLAAKSPKAAAVEALAALLGRADGDVAHVFYDDVKLASLRLDEDAP